jgi:hypothetical protein
MRILKPCQALLGRSGLTASQSLNVQKYSQSRYASFFERKIGTLILTASGSDFVCFRSSQLELNRYYLESVTGVTI